MIRRVWLSFSAGQQWLDDDFRDYQLAVPVGHGMKKNLNFQVESEPGGIGT
jgi:hypothetical protein